ncbi:hypothetical protein GCM10009092_18530 [Bowmanella denitrificans]|uniref:STAS domain-containing protein n=1 Tax=Bowmanella denitrificans TaxID=366582 RepID=A0ABN0X416_9ALTE|nr:STAS domain-containing protein [Bowmanella denitrificans]
MSGLSLRAQSQPGQFDLSGSLTRDHVMGLASACQQLWKHNSLVLDLAGIQQSDMAGLAWLVQLVGEAHKQKVEVQLHNLPVTLRKLAKISDVESLLPLQ